MRNNGDFGLLRDSYDSLVKAGRGSLEAAYAFGQVCDALNRVGYTQATLAQAVGVSPPTIATYLKLFRKYPTEHQLLHVAEELGTYDVSKLNGSVPAAPAHYVYHCLSCGSFEVKKERVPDDTASLGAVTHPSVTG
jgi:transcriptional regulator with XRE-family HTH domain